MDSLAKILAACLRHSRGIRREASHEHSDLIHGQCSQLLQIYLYYNITIYIHTMIFHTAVVLRKKISFQLPHRRDHEPRTIYFFIF